MKRVKKNPKSIGFSEGMLVAGRANPRHAKPTKQEKRLAIRIADYEKMLAGSKNDLSRSHRKPGSLQ